MNGSKPNSTPHQPIAKDGLYVSSPAMLVGLGLLAGAAAMPAQAQSTDLDPPGPYVLWVDWHVPANQPTTREVFPDICFDAGATKSYMTIVSSYPYGTDTLTSGTTSPAVGQDAPTADRTVTYTPPNGFKGYAGFFRASTVCPKAQNSLANTIVRVYVDPAPPTAVPTLEAAALGSLGALVGLSGLAARRRQRRKD